MLRRALFDRGPSADRPREVEDDFQWRGEGVSRLENLSDIVFAFALSFLVASSDVPENFAQLQESLVGFFALAFCFAILLLVWHSHYTFFRRYGLEDGRTVWLNAILLFLILLFVYPLRFVAHFQTNMLLGRFETPQDLAMVLSLDQMPALQLVYSGGYAAVFAIFALLYRHAGNLHRQLELTPVERVLTAERVVMSWVHVGVGLAAVGLAFALPTLWAPVSWFVYFLIWPLLYGVTRPYKRQYRELTSGV